MDRQLGRGSAGLDRMPGTECAIRVLFSGSAATFAPIGEWAEALREPPLRVAVWKIRLQGESIRGADLVFACIGPVLEFFCRNRAVMTAEGRVVGLPEFLEKVWEADGRTALEQVLGTLKPMRETVWPARWRKTPAWPPHFCGHSKAPKSPGRMIERTPLTTQIPTQRQSEFLSPAAVGKPARRGGRQGNGKEIQRSL